MNAVTITEGGSAWVNIATVILTDDDLENEALVVRACENYYSCKCRMYMPVDWESLNTSPSIVAILIREDDDEEYEMSVDLHFTVVYEKDTYAYFLFGHEAIGIYSEGGVEDLVEASKKGVIFSVFKWAGRSSTPFNLLCEYDGWAAFFEITEDEYDMISKTLEEK